MAQLLSVSQWPIVVQDPAEVLAREYPGKIDIAYEGVGGPLRDAVVDNLAAGGHCLAVGYIGSYSHTTDTHAHGALSPLASQLRTGIAVYLCHQL